MQAPFTTPLNISVNRSLPTAAAVCLLSLLAVIQNHSYASDVPTMVTASTPAAPTTIVPPEFPPKGEAPAAGVKVDITGTVLLDGTLTAVSIAAPEGYQSFATAVSDVLKWWRFTPAIDAPACAPKQQAVAFSIWFEGTVSQPRIFVTMPKQEKTEKSAESAFAFEYVSAPRIELPSNLSALEGQVELLLKVNESGTVDAVTVLSSTPYGAFSAIAIANAKRTKVKWAEPGPSRPLCASRKYKFCQSSASETVASHSGCVR
jgi:TonB family protein